MTAGGILSKQIRLQAIYNRLTGGNVEDDVMVTTHDFRILDTVWPDDGTGGTTHNYAAMEATFATFWGSVKPYVGPVTRLVEYRWYRNDGGDRDWGEPARVQTIATPVAGTATSGMCPPQVACTVTELTDSRRHWGRFYIPGISTIALVADGRLATTPQGVIATAAQTLYNAWNNQGVRCVVLGTVKPDFNAATMPATSWIGDAIERSIGRGETDNRIAVAYDVKQIRVDDVLDIQRRRRYTTPTTRNTKTVT